MKYSSLRAANEARQAEWPGASEADLCFRALEMAGEAGEAANKAKKLVRLERGIANASGHPDVTVEDLALELADVIITTDLLALELGVDLAEYVIRAFNAKSERLGLQTRLAG